MRLLFIKTKNIGDALLMTPTLAAVRQAYPDAEIWTLVRRGTEGILEGCPCIDRLVTTAAPESQNRRLSGWLEDTVLLSQLRRQRFDFAFDLSSVDRSRFFTSFSGAHIRATNPKLKPTGIWQLFLNAFSTQDLNKSHQVEMNFFTVNEFLPLRLSTPPPLVFDPARARESKFSKEFHDYIVFHPATRWKRKQWSIKHWIQVGRDLLADCSRIIVSVGPSPEEIAMGDAIVEGIGPCATSTRGELDWAQLAGILFRARLFVGVDTAAMHLAAACQTPIVALFGPTNASEWHPWSTPHELPKPTEQPENSRPLTSQCPDQVTKAARKMAK